MKIKFMMAATLIAAAACNQIQTSEDEKETAGEKDRVTVTVNVSGGASTRATGITEANETALSDTQIFVFDSSGKIESYVKGSNTLNVSTGKKTFVAMVNCPESLKSVSTKTELMESACLLENNYADHFEMVGETSQNITAKTTVNLTVERLVSKVVIEKVTTAFTSSYLAGQTFTINGIYLTNVVSKNNYNMAATSLEWVNKLKVDSANPAKKVTQDTGLTGTVPYTTRHSFYCFPNACTDDATTATWSERHTRLVVDTTLGYYTVKLPVLQRNRVYTIKELTITKRGSSDPWVDITTADATFSITVKGWETGNTDANVTI